MISDHVKNFSRDHKKVIGAMIKRYPAKRQASAVLPILRLAQDHNGGWLSQALMEEVARILNMAPIRVYEVATFHSMFHLTPMGRYHIHICTSVSCWLRGADKLLAQCEQILSLGDGKTSTDQAFSLSSVECLGACVNAPVVSINHDYYEDVTPETLAELLNAAQRGSLPPSGSLAGRHSSEASGSAPKRSKTHAR